MRTYICLVMAAIALCACSHEKFDSANSASSSSSSSANGAASTELASQGSYVWILHGYHPADSPFPWCLDASSAPSFSNGVYYFNAAFVTPERPVEGQPCDPAHGSGVVTVSPPARVVVDISQGSPIQPPPGAVSSPCYQGEYRELGCELAP